MDEIIKQRQVVADSWQLLKSSADVSIAVTPVGDVIVPLRVWREQRDTLLAREGRLGVWLEGSDDPAAIKDDLANFALIAVNFTAFVDGRGYSIARLLRERYKWRGELRAIGDVLRDQLFYLSRCGFDSFALRADQDAKASLAAFDDFSEAYQSSVERAQPLFRRRKTAVAAGADQ